MDRTRELVALAPVGISTILLSREGVRGVAYERLGTLPELDEEELGGPPGAAGLPVAWLSPRRLALSGPRYESLGRTVVPTNLVGVVGLGLALNALRLGAGEDIIDPYSSTVEESSAACR